MSLPNTMKALEKSHPQEGLWMVQAPVPEIGPDEVLIKVKKTGICGTDIHIWNWDEWAAHTVPVPLITGHEFAGEIVEIGRNVEDLAVGQRCSGEGHLIKTDSRQSRAGKFHLDPGTRGIGVNEQGAFAQYLAIPERNLVPIPDGMDINRAALAEPLATGWHAVVAADRATDRPLTECRALVFGGGAVGLAAALALRAQGCREIEIAETNPLRRETVSVAGIGRAFDPREDQAIAPTSVDLVIDCVGGRATRMAASQAVRPGGVIVHVGLMDSDDGLDIRKLTLQEVTFIGTYTYTMQDFRATVTAMHAGALGNLDWFEVRSLANGGDAFDDLLRGRTSSAKIILRPD